METERHDLVLNQDIREAIKFLKEYINTYENQQFVDEYSSETWVNDILYGLGLSLDPEEYKMADGYRKFKQKLRDFL